MQGEKIVVVRCKGAAKMRMIESSSQQRGIPTHQVKYEPHEQKPTTPASQYPMNDSISARI
jgi:hypothetical protein